MSEKRGWRGWRIIVAVRRVYRLIAVAGTPDDVETWVDWLVRAGRFAIVWVVPAASWLWQFMPDIGSVLLTCGAGVVSVWMAREPLRAGIRLVQSKRRTASTRSQPEQQPSLYFSQLDWEQILRRAGLLEIMGERYRKSSANPFSGPFDFQRDKIIANKLWEDFWRDSETAGHVYASRRDALAALRSWAAQRAFAELEKSRGDQAKKMPMRRVLVVLAMAGCGGEEDLFRPTLPPEPEPPPAAVRVRLNDRSGGADIFEGWPVVVGADTVTVTREGRFVHGVSRDEVFTIHVALEAARRRYYEPDANGYRATAWSHSGYGSIFDTVAVEPWMWERGDTLGVDLDHRRDFLVSFALSGEGGRGRAGRELTLADTSGSVLDRRTADENGEVLLSLRGDPALFAVDLLDWRWDRTGLKCGGAGAGRIDIAANLAQYSPRGTPGEANKVRTGRVSHCTEAP